MRPRHLVPIFITASLCEALTVEPRQAAGTGKGARGGAPKGKGTLPAAGPDAAAATAPSAETTGYAMKNGWEPMQKPPPGKGSEPCRAAIDCDYSHLVMDELTQGQCKAVTFIFARATTEQGNMGAAAGSGVARYLVGHYGPEKVAIQGVKYPADFGGNMSPGGCSAAGINEATRLFNLAHTKCPKTVIVAGGYSQGTACMHRSIPKLNSAIRDKIAGVVLFGDTQAAQTGRKIQGLDANRVKIYCNAGDAVCSGTLLITSAHFQYTPNVAPATMFLIGNIDAALSKSGA